MAAVPIQISGVLYDLLARTTQRVVIMGDASIMGLTVGGGPILPPEEVPPQAPPGSPVHPIWGPPGIDFPDKPGYPPVAGHPLPEPPEIPPPDQLPQPVPPNTVLKPPPSDGGWGLYSDASSSLYWAYTPAGQAQPK